MPRTPRRPVLAVVAFIALTGIVLAGAPLSAGISDVPHALESLGLPSPARLAAAPADTYQPTLAYGYADTLGTSGGPYVRSAVQLNVPAGLAADGDAVWIADSAGRRLLKFANAGRFLDEIGRAGLTWGIHDDPVREIADVAVYYATPAPGSTATPTPRATPVPGAATPAPGLEVVWFVDPDAHVAVGLARDIDAVTVIGEADEPGADNAHLDAPTGIAVDAAGNVYVGDTGNERVQIFGQDGSFLATIGTTGQAGAGNDQLSTPMRLAVSPDRKLYVADSGNHRVQAFDVSNPRLPRYLRTYGRTGQPGLGADRFDRPTGVAVATTLLYVADTGNCRAQVITLSDGNVFRSYGSAAGCQGTGAFVRPSDVAQDSLGYVYVADAGAMVVRQFRPWDGQETFAFGSAGLPYVGDVDHFNEPAGVAVASDGAVTIVERAGHRVLHRAADGSTTWTFGSPGLAGSDATHLDHPADAAVDGQGRAWVVDSGNDRLVVLRPDGTVERMVGRTGTADGELDCPQGIAVTSDGRAWVADTCNRRVQRFGSDGAHQTTLTWSFQRPADVALDATGTLFVADAGRHTVEVFSASLVHQRTLGSPGQAGDAFDRFSKPSRLATDSANRLYVADTGNDRVQVLAADGTFVTTVAGRAGTRDGDLREPLGLAVAATGRLFVADSGNHRVQVFAPAADPWTAAATNGFGRRDVHGVSALAGFSAALWAGDYVPSGGATVRRRDPATGAWAAPATSPLADPADVAVTDLAVFGGRLYAGGLNLHVTTDPTTGVQTRSSVGGALVRSTDGSTWESVADRGFGSRDQAAIGPLHEFKGMLLAGTTSIKDTRGAEVWRSTTGDRGSWVRGADNGWDDPTNVAIGSMGVFTNALYVGTCNRSGGGQIWRTNNGITWAASGTGGTGPIDARGPACVSGLTEFDGYLYAALGNDSRLAPTRSTAAVWRCRGCVGDDWEPVATSGFGVATNRGRTALGVLDEPPFRFLYLAVGNYDGLQVWRTLDGEYWEQSAVDGFGDSNAADVFGSAAFAVHDGRLYLGAINAAGAGELWSTGGARPDVSRPTAPSVATPTPRAQPTPPTGRTAYGVVDQWPVVGVIPPDAIGTVDDMTIADDGTAYLADRATNRVMRIGPDGKWGTPIGNVGRGPERIGQIGALLAYSDGAQAYVGAIAADTPRDRLYVSDLASERLVVYTLDGDLVDVWPNIYASGIDVLPDGRVWIADRMAGAVRLLDGAGSEVTRFGTYGNRGEDQFRRLQDVAVDPAGNLFVTDLAGARLRGFRPQAGGGFKRYRTIDLGGRADFAGCNGYRMQALGVERLLLAGCVIQGPDRELVLPATRRGSDLYGIRVQTANVAAGRYYALATYDIDPDNDDNETYPVLAVMRDDEFDVVTGTRDARWLDARSAGASGAIQQPLRLSTAPDGSLMLTDGFGLRQRGSDGTILAELPVELYPGNRNRFDNGTLRQQRRNLVGEGSGGRVMGVTRGRTNLWMAFYAETEYRRYCNGHRCSVNPYLKIVSASNMPALTENNADAIAATAHEPVGNQFVILTRYRSEPRLVASQLVIFPLAFFSHRIVVELPGDETDTLWADVDAGPTGRIYVLDTLNDRVKVLSSDLKDLGMVPTPKDVWRVAGGPNDEIYFLTVYGHVVRTAADGTVLSRFVGRPHEGVAATSLVDLAVDRGGWVYTLDEMANQVTVFAPTGTEQDVLQGGTCNIAGDKWAEPRDVLLGSDVRLYLRLFGTCGFVEEPADIVLAINSRGQSDGLLGALADNLRAARQVAALTDLDRHRLAVVAYTLNAEVAQTLTHETARVVRALRNAHAGRGNPSNTYVGLVAAGALFEPATGRKKVIILVGPRAGETDANGITWAERLKADGVLIMSVNGTSEAASGDVFDEITVPLRAMGGGKAAHRRMVERHYPAVLVGSGTLSDRLPANMRYVAGSANPAATWDAGSRTLTWTLANLALNAPHTFTLDVEPSQEGEWPTNVDAVADVVDGWGNAARVVLPVPRVRVYGALPTATPTITLTPTPRPETNTPTPEPTATPRPTPVPTPIYLPIVVRDKCTDRQKSADVALVIDTSGSMSDTTSEGGPTKLEAARDAARRFLGQLEPGRDQAAIIQFNVEATIVVPLTDDPAAAVAGLDRLTQASGTRIDLAFGVARDVLIGPGRRAGNNPVLILLTDGEPTGTTREEVLASALRADEAGILVFTIGLGASIDADLLRGCAGLPEWFFHAPDTSDLAAIYDQIAFRIPCVPLWP